MRRKRKGSIRYVDGDDDEEDPDDQEEEDYSRTDWHNGPPLGQTSTHITENEYDIERDSGNVGLDSPNTQANKQFGSYFSVGNGSKSVVSCSERKLKDQDSNADHTAETGHVKTEPQMAVNEIRSDSGEVNAGNSEDNLSSIMDNSWYSVKARKREDGLKEFVFVCRICDKLCNRRANMEDHIRSHAGIKPFNCKFCHAKLSRKQNLKSHFTKMHKFSDAEVKSLLEEVDSPDPAVNCRELRQYLRDTEKYCRRVNQNLNVSNKMTFSDFQESTAINTDTFIDNKPESTSDSENNQNLALNNGTKHYNDRTVKTAHDDELTFSDIGSKRLEDYGEFTCIQVVPKDGQPTKLYRCKTCQYECSRRYTMRTHTWIHTGVKRYYCEICDAEYTKNTFLKIHLAKDHSITHPDLDDMVKRASENAVPGILTIPLKHERNSSGNVKLDTDLSESNDVTKLKGGNISDTNNQMTDAVDSVSKTMKYEDCNNVVDDKRAGISSTANVIAINEKIEDYGNFTCIEVTDKLSQSKIYRCKVCSYECTRRYTMKTHAWTHSGYKRFCCILCGNSFTRSTYFRFHLRKAHSVTGAELDSIVKEASQQEFVDVNQSQVEAILTSDDEYSKYISGDSREASPSKENFSQHQEKIYVNIRNSDTLECSGSKCKETYEEVGTASEETVGLDMASFIKSEQSDAETFNTSVDDNGIDDSSFYSSENSSKESSVEKELVSDDSVRDIIETLMDCKTLQCLKCSKVYSSKTNLKSHVKTHFNIKPYACPICQKRFGKNGNMKEHAKIMHRFLGPFPEADAHATLHTDKIVTLTPLGDEQTKDEIKSEADSPFQIKIETEEDSYEPNYDQMTVDHNEKEGQAMQYDESEFMDVKNLRCKKCQKTYTSKGNLKAHVKLHFNLRPFACPVCKQKFNNSSNMRVHARKMHNFSAFSIDCSSDLVVKEALDSFKSENWPKIATELSETQIKDERIDISENHEIDSEHLSIDDKIGESESKINVKDDLSEKESIPAMFGKEGKQITGISFETMAEELWGYNEGFAPNPTKGSLEIKKEIEEDANELNVSEQNKVNNPYKFMKQENLDKTDYNNMMTDLMKMAGPGSSKLMMSQAAFNSLPLPLGVYSGLPTSVSMNTPEILPNLMGKNDHTNVRSTMKRKTRESLPVFNVTNLIDAEENVRKHNYKVESLMKFNPASMGPTLTKEQNPPHRFPGVRTSPFADPNIVKLKTLMDEDHLQCRDCFKRFANKWSLKAHVKAIHLKGKQFTCSVCFKTFNFKCNLERHYIVHNPNWTKEKAPFEPFLQTETEEPIIEKGDKSKESDESVRDGSKNGDNSSNESISDTGSAMKLPVNLESPMKLLKDTESPFTLSEDLESPSKQLTDDDLYDAKVENLMDLDYFQCKKCLKQFANKWSLKAHVKSIHVHSRKYRCPVCQKSFNHKCNLDRHFVIHPEYDPKKEAESNESSEFQCTFCKKSFANKWSMKAHINAIHINSRQYSCPLCQKMFNHKCNLERHIIRHVGEGSINGSIESETDEMPLDLSSDSGKDEDSMNKSVDDSEVPPEIPKGETDALSFDERILMDMDKMKCIKCGKRFGDKTDLKEHVRGHLNRNLTCAICQRSFNSTEKLKRHYNTCTHFTEGEFVKGEKKDWFPGNDIQRDNSSGENYIPGTKNVIDDTTDDKKVLNAEDELPLLGSEDDGPVFCGLCGDKFPNRNDLHAHFKTHEEF